jgi:acetyl/propionyl-CoA carboxylase alpha subunit
MTHFPSGWRNVVSADQHRAFRDVDGTEHRVSYRVTRTGTNLPEDAGIVVVSATPDEVNLAREGVVTMFMVARYGDHVYVDSPLGSVFFTSVSRFPEPASEVRQGSLLAPMPGSVIRLGADLGDTVTTGQPLIWLEAMKMEHTVNSPADGVLAQICVAIGQQVEVGAVLARVETQGDADD